MNTINVKLKAIRLNPFKSNHNWADHSELAPFSIEIDNLISAEKIMTQQKLAQSLKAFIQDQRLREADIVSALNLESQLNSLGEFCISFKNDLKKYYFIIKVAY